MFSVSQTVSYAIQALTCLAGESCPHDFIQEIAECSGVPKAYLAKILKRLNTAGLVRSKRGYKGGIWLARPPKDISLWDVVVAIDGEACLSKCLLGDEFCDDERDCPTYGFWKDVRPAIHRELSNTTMADIVAFSRRRARKHAGTIASAAPRLHEESCSQDISGSIAEERSPV